jgi:hypothetical protein
MRVDWGSVPDWLAGSGAVVALVFAAVAARAAWEASRMQTIQLAKLEDAERQRRDDDERVQASRVGLWIRIMPDGSPAVACLNGSGLPIYRLEIGVVVGGEELSATTTYAFKGPDLQPGTLRYATSELLISRKSEIFDRADVGSWSEVYQSGRIALVVRFVDTFGRGWARSGTGHLSRIESS